MHREGWAGGPPDADPPSEQVGAERLLPVKHVSSRFHAVVCPTACISDSEELLSKH